VIFLCVLIRYLNAIILENTVRCDALLNAIAILCESRVIFNVKFPMQFNHDRFATLPKFEKYLKSQYFNSVFGNGYYVITANYDVLHNQSFHSI